MSSLPRPVRPRLAVGGSAVRVGVVLCVLLVASTIAASPASATLYRDDGDDPGESLTTVETLLIFGAIPIGATLLIALLAALPSILSGPRYRPGQEWQAEPEWYGAPGSELGSGAPGELGSGGSLTGTVVADPAETPTSTDDGGTSARW